MASNGVSERKKTAALRAVVQRRESAKRSKETAPKLLILAHNMLLLFHSSR